MKFLVIGYGSIGKRHVGNLKNILKGPKDIIICRKPGEDKVPGFETFFNLNKALAEKPTAAIVATPASAHMPIALACAKAGVHLFIEKPVSNNLKGVRELALLTKKKDLTVMIGCNFRFHPGLKQAKELVSKNKIGKVISVVSQAGQYLPDWRQGVKYQKTCSARKSLGGGVVLELIHELDYLYWLFGRPKNIHAFVDKLSSLDIDVEDTADILLRFKNNVQANVHLDYIQRQPQRTYRIIGEKGTIIWDYFKNSLEIQKARQNTKRFSFKNFERNDMYIDEMRHFIKCLKSKQKPLIDLRQGVEVLSMALDIKKHGAR